MCLLWVSYSTAKRPDWAMQSWSALNINEFTLFNMFESPWKLVKNVNKFAGSVVLTRTHVKSGQC